MLYKLGSSNDKFDSLEAVAFKDFSNFGQLEKDLENLIADNILSVLFEDAGLMPIFQERQYQAEADIYALNEKGDLVIFELKRSSAGEGAIHQALRYAQDAGQWSFSKLQKKYQQYTNSNTDLISAHKEAFNLEHPLDAKSLNNKQLLFVIGSAADDSLINAVDYWKKQGISIEFLPYRIYEIGDEKYFEFFSLPYDKHKNPSAIKGVLFNTNKIYNPDSVWYMMENNRVAAFGDAKKFVRYVHPNDIVFFVHRGVGLIAAAKVKKGDIQIDEDVLYGALYREVEFITPTPKRGNNIKGMSFSKVSEITGRSFFWAKTTAVPYLSSDEAENLARELKTFLES